jgi:hypothetical protein
MQKVNRKLLGFTLMERVDESLESYLDKNPKPSTAVLHSISDQFVNVINVMKKNHISHGDLWFHNIGVSIDHKGVLTLRLLDFDKGSIEKSYTDLDILGLARNLFGGQAQVHAIAQLRILLWPRLRTMFVSPYLRKNPPQDSNAIKKRWKTLYENCGKTRFTKVANKHVLCGQETKKGTACSNYKFSCRWHNK